MNRRGFLGSLIALVCAPFVPKVADPICERCGRLVSAHTHFDKDVYLEEAVKNLAKAIDQRLIDLYMQSV